MLKVQNGLSIITVCCNRLEYTIATIAGIISRVGNKPYEYIVVDANSTDGTREWLEYIKNLEYFKHVRSIHLEQNLGVWKNSGAGVKAAVYDNVLVTDNDMRIVEGENISDIFLDSLKSHAIVMAGVVPEQKTRSEILYPVGCFAMNKSNFRFDYRLPDDYKHSGIPVYQDNRVMVKHMDGWEKGQSGEQLSKVKYPAHVIYNNLAGDCPMGKAPFRKEGCESQYWKAKQ